VADAMIEAWLGNLAERGKGAISSQAARPSSHMGIGEDATVCKPFKGVQRPYSK